MINCKEEFLEETKDKVVKCAFLRKVHYAREFETEFILAPGFNQSSYDSFLQALDFDYDDGFGSQEIDGTIWYTDGTWSERFEYDGSECWQYKCCPEIPEVMK
jgi:hypothetical protein